MIRLVASMFELNIRMDLPTNGLYKMRVASKNVTQAIIDKILLLKQEILFKQAEPPLPMLCHYHLPSCLNHQ